MFYSVFFKYLLCVWILQNANSHDCYWVFFSFFLMQNTSSHSSVHSDDLKIADFGLATIFRYQGKWRLLERLCGSAPYLAPEVVNNKPYKAEPADIWSCGIVLVAMLGGGMWPWHSFIAFLEIGGQYFFVSMYMVWGQDSSVEECLPEKPGAVLTRVWVPRCSKGFFSLCQLPVQTLLRSLYRPHFQSHTSTSGRTLKIPITGSHNIVWTHEDKILHTLLRMGSAALATAVPYAGKAFQISHKGQRSTNKQTR